MLDKLTVAAKANWSGARRGKLATLASLALAVSVAAATAAPEAAASDPGPARAAKLKQGMDELLAAGAPGAIVLVRDGDQTLRLTSGYGNVATTTPMRATDRFRIGSVTKTFVATVVLQLVGEGKLGLDDTTERWLPGLVPNGERITIRQLLNHTSGLFNITDDPKFLSQVMSDRRKVWAPRRIVEFATTHAPLFAPGAKWSYSNTGYIALGLIVEAATGRSLEAELSREILEPLGLRSTTFDNSPRIAGQHAHGYYSPGAPPLEDVSVFSPSAAWAAGAIVSTADDVARFYRALLGGRLLRPDLLRAMKATVSVAPGAGYGLGLFTTRVPCGAVWGHDGDFPGYLTHAFSSANGRRQIVVLINTSGGSFSLKKALDRLLMSANCD